MSMEKYLQKLMEAPFAIIQPMEKDLKNKKYPELARRLTAVREALGYKTQSDFAKGAGISYKSYSQCENGTHSLSLPNAIRLRERYGISLDFIYCGSLDTLPHKIASALSSIPLDSTSSTSKVNGDA